jgi:SAM-dependent methyltransferase
MSITQTDFWEKQWQNVIEVSPIRRRRPDSHEGKLVRWNKMAPEFARRVGSEKSAALRRETISTLRAQGVLKKEFRVLDIGAGPGAWALPMAGHSLHVTALEPADAMADILASRISEAGVDNIAVERRTWQSADLGELGWYRAFDLVFASMTPGIDGPAALKKMMAASRGYCYLSAVSGPGWQSQYAGLWEIFFNEPMGEMSNDIIHPFNLVYAMGFRPSLTFSVWEGQRYQARDEAVRQFVQFFESHMEMTQTAEAIIGEYVDSLCQDGQYLNPRDIYRGTMIWQVEQSKAAAA